MSVNTPNPPLITVLRPPIIRKPEARTDGLLYVVGSRRDAADPALNQTVAVSGIVVATSRDEKSPDVELCFVSLIILLGNKSGVSGRMDPSSKALGAHTAPQG